MCLGLAGLVLFLSCCSRGSSSGSGFRLITAVDGFAFAVNGRRSAYLVTDASGGRRSLSVLRAKKAKRRSSPSRTVKAGGSGGGGGFGSTRSAAGTKSNTKYKPVSSARSISGQVGSGNKALRSAANAYDGIRQKYCKDVDDEERKKELLQQCCRDVYVRSPLHSETTYWFVGKIAFDGGTTPVQSAVSQKRLILEYSQQQLRPLEMGGKYSKSLEVWLAPGDSEMDVVRNTVTLERVAGNAATVLPQDFDIGTTGYNPEIYIGDEISQGGLRVERDENGCPTKPVFDINQSA